MVNFLEITSEEMISDARRKYGELSLDELSEVLKSLKSNTRYAEALDIARLKAHGWISQGRFRALEKNNLEFVQKHEFETKVIERARIKDNKIEKYQEKMYRLVHDYREDYPGRDISELEILDKIDIDSDDIDLDTLEKIKKYAVSENLDRLKRALASEQMEIAARRVAEAAAALQNHKTKIAVVMALQAELRAKKAAEIARSRAGFLTPEGRKLFGL